MRGEWSAVTVFYTIAIWVRGGGKFFRLAWLKIKSTNCPWLMCSLVRGDAWWVAAWLN